ncbi:hypothetical protein ABZ590_07530, partial [Streptomyces hirsutus]|uniref:hypothetical protein n=1 Tax=Streptomyces hirsutus TaxID=35620 RepID=UPI00340D0329
PGRAGRSHDGGAGEQRPAPREQLILLHDSSVARPATGDLGDTCAAGRFHPLGPVPPPHGRPMASAP